MNEPMFRLTEDGFGRPRRSFAGGDAAPRKPALPSGRQPAPAPSRPLAGAAATAS